MTRLYPLARRRLWAAFLPFLFLGPAAGAADEAQRLDTRYAEVRQELSEEYIALSRERDASRDRIFDALQGLRRGRGAAMEKYSRDSIDTLQQLYQLNDRRYHELVRALNSRERLEELRYREERELLSRRLGPGERGEGDGRLAEAMYEDMRVRYRNELNALDTYRDLVNERLKAQAEYLRDYNGISAEFAGGAEADAARYSERLAELNERKDVDERLYQDEVRFIKERLTREQAHNREMLRLAEERRVLAGARSRERRRFEERLHAVRVLPSDAEAIRINVLPE